MFVVEPVYVCDNQNRHGFVVGTQWDLVKVAWDLGHY